jgi:glycosyltransferase involved in cell wall biosynthesis
MKVLFVNHIHLDSNSGIHIFNLANHLARMGVECTVCVPDHKQAVNALGTPLFTAVEPADLRAAPGSHSFDLIHAWTPREAVRLLTEELQQIYHAPYIVHLEDNEEALVAGATGIPFEVLQKLPASRLDALIPPHLSHPRRYKEFLMNAAGISVVMDTLLEFCPPDRPSRVIWAGYEESMDWSRAADPTLRTRLGIDGDERVIVYTGNVHWLNRGEVFSLYLAVALLNRRGLKTRLVRTGTDYVDLINESWSINEASEALQEHCINMGHVPRRDLPSILSIANVLVQPGRGDAFNAYRFPAKVPEFLATGKPVLLPATNIGRFLKDGEECVLLHEGNAVEIAQKLARLFEYKAAGERIGAGGRLFAEKHLTWHESAEKLRDFYGSVLAPGKVQVGSAGPEAPTALAVPDFSVVVFQMGKVGSRAVYESLVRAYESLHLNVDVQFRHILTGFAGAEAAIKGERTNPAATLAEIQAGRELRLKIDQDPGHKWKIVTLVRDPIARNIGTFFQVLDEHVPDWRQRDPADPSFIDELQDAFLRVRTIHTEPERWFDEQLLPVFGVDVYASAFPRDKGYQIFNPSPRVAVLLIRLEDLSRCASAAMKEFLDLEEFVLREANVGAEKEYAELYASFKHKPLPLTYVQAMYGSRLAIHFYDSEERQALAAKWSGSKLAPESAKAVALNRDPILIYQMGKVGSVSVQTSLERAYGELAVPVQIHRIHLMNLSIEDATRILAPEYPDPWKTLGAIRNGLEFRKVLEQSPNQAWKLISLVREPVGRNIATFFQSLEEFLPDWKERRAKAALTVEDLHKLFLEKQTLHQGPSEWFDNELKAVFGIDVYASSFPAAVGYKIYPDCPRTPLLVIRLEDLDRCAQVAMKEFLGLETFALHKANVGEEKEYSDLYRAFRKEPLPAWYIEEMYRTAYARHFYTTDELQAFGARWLGSTTDGE